MLATNAFHSTNLLLCFSRCHFPTISVAPSFCLQPTRNPQFLDSLWRRADARNIGFRISLRWQIHINNSVDKTKCILWTTVTCIFCNSPTRFLFRSFFCLSAFERRTSSRTSYLSQWEGLQYSQWRNKLCCGGLWFRYLSQTVIVRKIGCCLFLDRESRNRQAE